MRTKTKLIVTTLLLSGCAAYTPVFDTLHIKDQTQFEIDLRQCQEVARNGGIDPATGAAVGAVVGGGLGAGLGAAVGSIGRQAGLGAGVVGILGGVSGLAAGAAHTAQRERIIVTRCMQNRGYRPMY